MSIEPYKNPVRSSTLTQTLSFGLQIHTGSDDDLQNGCLEARRIRNETNRLDRQGWDWNDINSIVVDGETGDPLFPVADWDSISGEDSAKVGVYASDFDRGLPFIAEHNAWSFINIASEPEYFCIYVNRPYQQIQLIGVVKDIVSKNEFIEGRDLDRDTEEIADSKKVIEFSDVYQLENPIPIGEASSRMQGLLYTTLGELRTADTTDDV